MKISRWYGAGLIFTALLLAPAEGRAATTASWEMNTYQDFLRGRFNGISLSRDGRLSLAPQLDTLFASEQPAIWSVAQAADGTLFAGTGHRGRLFRIEKSGKSSLLWTADQPEIFAVALDGNDVIYAATSPDGKIYRIEKGKAAEYFDPKSRYVWALAFGPDGALYAGTGDQGKVFRIERAGQGEVYYETGQMHVTSLAFDRNGLLLAGSEPNGILYRISAKDKAFVLYDANLPEIRRIIPGPDGSIYAAAMGGSVAGRMTAGAAAGAAGGGTAPVAAPGMSITVTDEVQAGLDVKPKTDAAKAAAAATPQVTTSFSPMVDFSGLIEKSALYRIRPDNTVETLWSSKEENVYDVAASENGLVFSTDGQGRIYRLGADRKVTLVIQTNEGEGTRLLQTPAGMLAATSNMGKIFRVGSGSGAAGVYESPVHDAGTVARWGRLAWRADDCANCKVSFQVRTGNSARPDRTWSDWSAPISDARNGRIQSPNARYVQWKAELNGAGSATPVLDSVTLAYLPQNNPPVVKNISVTSGWTGAAGAAKPQPAQSASTAAYSITVTDTGEAGPSTVSGTPTQALSRSASQQMQITWQAEDVDGDRLVYAIYFRGEEEREWKLLKSAVYETQLSVDADVLADGRYFFRVIASDRPANPADSAAESELIGAPVLIDNTPPVVTAGSTRRLGSQVEIEFEAVDQASSLQRCEYSLNASSWVPLQAADGVIDSPRERFVVTLNNLPPGEQLVVVRAYDSAGNAGLTKVIVR